jgi:hypothetical protein
MCNLTAPALSTMRLQQWQLHDVATSAVWLPMEFVQCKEPVRVVAASLPCTHLGCFQRAGCNPWEEPRTLWVSSGMAWSGHTRVAPLLGPCLVWHRPPDRAGCTDSTHCGLTTQRILHRWPEGTYRRLQKPLAPGTRRMQVHNFRLIQRGTKVTGHTIDVEVGDTFLGDTVVDRGEQIGVGAVGAKEVPQGGLTHSCARGVETVAMRLQDVEGCNRCAVCLCSIPGRVATSR